jgi:hypothetical protein
MSGDIATSVFSAAPYWMSASTWHCRHPDSSNEASYIKVIGPHTSEEVSRQLREVGRPLHPMLRGNAPGCSRSTACDHHPSKCTTNQPPRALPTCFFTPFP